VEDRFVLLGDYPTVTVLAAEVVDAVHGWADDPAGPQSCQAG
jgi:hypothetical protein